MIAQRRRDGAEIDNRDRDPWTYLGAVLFLELAKNLLGFLYFRKRELAGLEKVRHDKLGAPAEQGQQVVDQLALGDVAGDRGFEDVEVADFL